MCQGRTTPRLARKRLSMDGEHPAGLGGMAGCALLPPLPVERLGASVPRSFRTGAVDSG